MKKYELVYIVHPDLETTIDKVSEKITKFIERKSGKVLKEENWGKKKLAYKIQKQDFGIYILVIFEAETKDLSAIENDVRLAEEVIRHLIVKKEEEDETPVRTPKPVQKPKEEAAAEVAVEEEEKPKKTKKEEEKDEKERLKKLDEKLDEIIGKE